MMYTTGDEVYASRAESYSSTKVENKSDWLNLQTSGIL